MAQGKEVGMVTRMILECSQSVWRWSRVRVEIHGYDSPLLSSAPRQREEPSSIELCSGRSSSPIEPCSGEANTPPSSPALGEYYRHHSQKGNGKIPQPIKSWPAHKIVCWKKNTSPLLRTPPKGL